MVVCDVCQAQRPPLEIGSTGQRVGFVVKIASVKSNVERMHFKNTVVVTFGSQKREFLLLFCFYFVFSSSMLRIIFLLFCIGYHPHHLRFNRVFMSAVHLDSDRNQLRKTFQLRKGASVRNELSSNWTTLPFTPRSFQKRIKSINSRLDIWKQVNQLDMIKSRKPIYLDLWSFVGDFLWSDWPTKNSCLWLDNFLNEIKLN